MRFLAAGCMAWVLTIAAGCEQQMADQPRYDPLEASRFFPDGRSVRPVIEGTVARGEPSPSSAFATGRLTDIPADSGVDSTESSSASYLDELPIAWDRVAWERGRSRFQIYCVPCHGPQANGTGIMVQHGFPHAPSLHSARLQEARVGYLFDVVTRGLRQMPAFGDRIPEADRWRLAGYVRSLQISAATGEPAPRAIIPVADDAREDLWQRAIPTDAGSGRFIVRPGGPSE